MIYHNEVIDKKKLQQLMSVIFHNYGVVRSSIIADRVKNLTFHYATISGISLSVEDLRVPFRKKNLVGLTVNEVDLTEQNFKIGNTSLEVILTPGHTKGHIAFYFKNEKIVFTGDTLFSLGCGRTFEGTHEQMLNSLNKLKNLPIETLVYCGHEYTKQNLEFCLKYDPNNELLQKKNNWINARLKSNSPTIPVSIGEEKKTNIFLRCNEPSVKDALNLNNASEQEIFSKLRDLKDNF